MLFMTYSQEIEWALILQAHMGCVDQVPDSL